MYYYYVLIVFNKIVHNFANIRSKEQIKVNQFYTIIFLKLLHTIIQCISIFSKKYFASINLNMPYIQIAPTYDNVNEYVYLPQVQPSSLSLILYKM